LKHQFFGFIWKLSIFLSGCIDYASFATDRRANCTFARRPEAERVDFAGAAEKCTEMNDFLTGKCTFYLFFTKTHVFVCFSLNKGF